MLLKAHSNEPSIEDLILMVIHNDTLCIVILRREEAVHPARIKEAIVQHDWRIADLPKVVVRITIELPDSILRYLCKERLIDGLYRNNDILHFWLRILLVEDPECLMSVRETVRITPAWVRQLLTTVVKSVLALRCTMQVNYHFESSFACPGNGSVEVRCRALSERAPRLDIGPVTDRDTDHVEAGVADLLEVLKRNEGVPVRFESVVAALLAELLAQGPFVNDGIVGSAVRFEDGGCNETVNM